MAQRLRHQELMDEVAPNIWLGQFESALDDQISNLESLDVTHVVSLGCFYGWWSLRTKPKHLLIPIEDKPLVFITDYFNDVFRFMDEALDSNHGVLVHCEQGRSRSGAMVIAYLMKKERQPYPEILNRVLAHRKRVMPNIGFQIQLRAFARNNFNTSIKYSEVLNLQAELGSALRNLHDQVLALQNSIQNSEKIFVTLGHDGSNQNRNDDDPDTGVKYPNTTMDTRSPFDPPEDGKPIPDGLRPQYPFEWWTNNEDTDRPNHWRKTVQVGLTTQDLVTFRKEWVLLVFLCHQFQLYNIAVNTDILSILNIIGEMYFEDLLETFLEVFTPVQRALDTAAASATNVSTGAGSVIAGQLGTAQQQQQQLVAAGSQQQQLQQHQSSYETKSAAGMGIVSVGSASSFTNSSVARGNIPSYGNEVVQQQQMNGGSVGRGDAVYILRRPQETNPPRQQTFVSGASSSMNYRPVTQMAQAESRW